MKSHFAAITFLGLADTVSTRHACYFPFFSKFDRPRTPCTCHSTRFIVNEEFRTFFEHAYEASEMHCTLATASDIDELNEMRTAAATFPQPEGGVSSMWIGLFRKTNIQLAAAGGGEENNQRNGDVGGPWKWFDDCTDYSFNAFENDGNRGDEPNDLGFEERAAIIRLFPDFGLEAGDIEDLPTRFLYPALYECCVDDEH